MATPIEEIHPELFHYTGIGGLEGILKTQTLWATHARYLNDAMELKAFKMRLPSILQPSVEKGIAELATNPDKQALIEQQGGSAKVIEEFTTAITNGMYNALLGTPDAQAFAEPYVMSFCTPGNDEQIKHHGLLSQWRGYGQEGGYAIVFDTARLVNFLQQEAEKWGPEYDLFGGDVVYSSDNDEKIRKELGEDIDTLATCIFNFLTTANQESLENVYPPLIRCACRYKHWGFHEEKEVRIIAIPPNKEMFAALKELAPHAKEKERHYFVRGGTPVPCIHLFDGITQLPDNPLPITRIIVGPHRNKNQKRHAMENLLRQYQLNIPVSVSEIPYVENS